MIDLSDDTRQRLQRLFPEPQWQEVEAILREDCGDTLPMVKPSWLDLVERIRFAVLKLSQGDLTRLKKHVKGARHDWRDVLMAAGFANSLTAHKDWRP